MRTRTTRGFTLLELLVVIGIIAAMSFFLVSGLTGGGVTAGLQSGQAAIANLITAARVKAPATGRKTRLLVNVDPAAPDRFLRHLVLQSARQSGASPADWDTVTAVTLPDGIYVVPATLTLAGGLVANPVDWKRVSDPSADLVSDLFTNQTLSTTLEGDASPQIWTGVAFTANSTLATLGGGSPPKGFLVLAPGARRAPGSYQPGESPVQLGSPQAVRGLVLSAYGVPALLNDRSSF
ncbi:MAG: type II secretion system protein [Opitutae bacterium]|nr:type II secretion system protein [Opitutae bacterium]